ncbi:MAG: hypothetical protein ABI718_01415 [Acidobacteriota bacterium]
MKRCAFLSTDDLTGHVTDDDLAIGPFSERGWLVEFVSWRQKETDWIRFEAVIIRSAWDYQHDPQSFLTVLEEIEQSGTVLANPLSLIRSNVSKTYLRELSLAGIAVVPTIWGRGLLASELYEHFQEFRADEIVVKPVIGASAGDTYRLSRRSIGEQQPELETLFHNREFMSQPFMKAIIEEGEFSLFYFNNTFSHAVQKSPKPGDFRVQEEHGGEIVSVRPPAACLAIGDRILRLLDPGPLYARIDLVRDFEGGFLLMELELIEPALYFRTDAQSAARFARAFEAWIERQRTRW